MEKIKKIVFSSPTEYSLKNASFRLHQVWGTRPADPAVTIAEVLPLPPSRTIGNVGVSTGARQPSLAKILSQIDAYLWLYDDNYERQNLYNKYKHWWYLFWLRCDRLSFENGPYPFVDAMQGVSIVTRQPLADVSVPEGGCVSGNEAIRYPGFITFT